MFLTAEISDAYKVFFSVQDQKQLSDSDDKQIVLL